MPPHLERVAVQRLCQTRNKFVSGSRLCDEGDGGYRAGLISAGDLDAIRVAGLVCKGSRGSGVVAGGLELRLTEKSLPESSGAREHDFGEALSGSEAAMGDGQWVRKVDGEVGK